MFTPSAFKIPAAFKTRGLLAALLALFTLTVGLAPANAADAYRYWGFYQESGSTWKYATKGPAQVVPADGAVDGWRFALVAGTTPRTPRLTPTFADLCAATPAVDGKKRVGIVIDFGRDVDAQTTGSTVPQPILGCAQVATNATSQQAVAAVAQVRDSKGMLCALNSWPATGCSDVVPAAKVPAAATAADTALAPTATASASSSSTASSNSTASSSASSSDSGSNTGQLLSIGAAVVLIAALGGLFLRNRSRTGDADQG